MELIGIIAEYNPFHNGHLYQLQEIRRRHPDAYILVIMSGSITQRGSIACLTKWQRAGCAVQNGADLVLELPCCFAVRSAQYFATGGVQLLHRLNAAKYLAFGAETSDLALLQKIASISTNEKIKTNLQENLQAGTSYATALGQAICQNIPEATEIIQQPNNILAVEYLKVMQKLQSGIEPLLIKRAVAPHHSQALTGKISSASAIRAALQQFSLNQEGLAYAMPQETLHLLFPRQAENHVMEDQLLPSLLTTLRLTKAKELAQIYNLNEGLENVLIEQAAKSSFTSLHDFCLGLKSKRYSYTRLRRDLIYILLHISSTMVEKFTKTGPLYARILSFNPRGQKILQQIKQNASVPLVTRPAKFFQDPSVPEIAKDMLKLDIQATELQSLCYHPIKTAGLDYVTSPVLIN